jgi:hypothetical protein
MDKHYEKLVRTTAPLEVERAIRSVRMKPETRAKGASKKRQDARNEREKLTPLVKKYYERGFENAIEIRNKVIADPAFKAPKGVNPKGERFLKDYVRPILRSLKAARA